MARVNEHGRLIAAAAKAALTSLGCRRVGQSRTWISDGRYWLVVVEFQPSSWSKGSYLNVGAMWLWHAQKGLGCDYGGRVANFISFESPEQFTPLIAGMAAQAAEEVLKLRQKFRSFADIHRHLVASVTRDGWPVYHAAVAAGLAGDIDTSRSLFHRYDTWAVSFGLPTKLKSDSAALGAVLDDRARYQSAVLAVIEQCRALNRLPADPACLDFINASQTVSK